MLMDAAGLTRRYPLNRPLTFKERTERLKPDRPLGVTPHAWLSTLRLNSSYLEMVGKFYDGKGFLAIVMIACLILFIYGVPLGVLILFSAIAERVESWLLTRQQITKQVRLHSEFFHA